MEERNHYLEDVNLEINRTKHKYGKGKEESKRQQFSSVQFSRSVVSDSLRPPWTVACQTSLSITNSQRLLKIWEVFKISHSIVFLFLHIDH